MISLGCFFFGERPDDDRFAALFLVSADAKEVSLTLIYMDTSFVSISELLLLISPSEITVVEVGVRLSSSSKLLSKSTACDAGISPPAKLEPNASTHAEFESDCFCFMSKNIAIVASLKARFAWRNLTDSRGSICRFSS